MKYIYVIFRSLPSWRQLSNSPNWPVNVFSTHLFEKRCCRLPVPQQRHILRQRPHLETNPGGNPLNKQRVRVTLRRPLTPRANRLNIFSSGLSGSFLFGMEHVFWRMLSRLIKQIYPPFAAIANLLPSASWGIMALNLPSVEQSAFLNINAERRNKRI